MKRNILIQTLWEEEKCSNDSCDTCHTCKVINLEERKVELKNNSQQLYAKEAESYFFYYAPNLKQV